MGAKNGDWKVAVPPDLAPLVPGFLERREADGVILRDHLEKGNFESIAIMAHKLKGTGAGYGFQKISELGEAMGNSAKQRSQIELEKQIEEFSQLIRELRSSL